MSMTLQILFWILILFILHTYLLYPVIMYALHRIFHKKHPEYNPDEFPFIYVVFSAFNEERVIEEKLRSIFLSNYPADRYRVYVGSDCSTDKTDELISRFCSLHTQLVFLPGSVRRGKSGVVNSLLDDVRTHAHQNGHTDSLVILTDANVLFTPDLLFELSRLFSDTRVGQVAARILNRGVGDGITVQESTYIRMESKLKEFEGDVFGAMQGAFGACYAIRLPLIPDIPSNFMMEDFYISMHVLHRGYKALARMSAICYEDLPSDIMEEYKRKRRISAGNWQNISVFWPMLFRPGALAFCFWSHKVLRWITPFFLLILAPVLFVLSFSSSFYFVCLLLFIFLCMTPLMERSLNSNGFSVSILRYPAYFMMMQWALLDGFFWYLRGISGGGWTPTKRNLQA